MMKCIVLSVFVLCISAILPKTGACQLSDTGQATSHVTNAYMPADTPLKSKETVDRCTVMLNPDGSFRIPCLTYAGDYYWADLAYSPAPNTFNFSVTAAGAITNSTQFTNCTPVTLSSTFLLYIPNMIFNSASFWMALQYVNQDAVFTYRSSGYNPSGTGNVVRNLLTYTDLMTGTPTLVDNSAYDLPENAAMPDHVFAGLLTISEAELSPIFITLTDDSFPPYASYAGRKSLPYFSFEFIQNGSYLIPVAQGLSITGNQYWNYIVGPGRVWKENSDQGYSRASFPFALVERNANCTHNGVMTFLFNNSTGSSNVSNVSYQITQETCKYFKFNMAGQLTAVYTPGSISNANSIKDQHVAELANRLPTKPIADLVSDFPASGVQLSNIGKMNSPDHMTAYGLVINGINYVSGCATRYGQYPFCENMRLPSYSTAKSAFASVALMRLGQKYGKGVYDFNIRDYVPIYSPRWFQSVTFKNTLDMATGYYSSPDFEDDETYNMTNFFKAESLSDKISTAFNFPYKQEPGQLWVYHSSDTFIVTRAMNNFLVAKEGASADIFNMVRDEVYTPAHLSAGAMTTLRTDNSALGAPFGSHGLFWTQDDIAKYALLLNNQNGAIDGKQILEPDMLAASMQKNPNNRGLITTGSIPWNYNNAFWAKQWGPSSSPSFPCSFWTPFMSGYGGISVIMMPNGSIYYEYNDNNEYLWNNALSESNKLKPMCQ